MQRMRGRQTQRSCQWSLEEENCACTDNAQKKTKKVDTCLPARTRNRE